MIQNLHSCLKHIFDEKKSNRVQSLNRIICDSRRVVSRSALDSGMFMNVIFFYNCMEVMFEFLEKQKCYEMKSSLLLFPLEL